MADQTTLGSIAPHVEPLPSERRRPADRQQLVQRIRSEFEEMPGQCLTLAQASRLFDVPPDRCARVFSELIDDGVLALNVNGRYRVRRAS